MYVVENETAELYDTIHTIQVGMILYNVSSEEDAQ